MSERYVKTYQDTFRVELERQEIGGFSVSTDYPPGSQFPEEMKRDIDFIKSNHNKIDHSWLQKKGFLSN